MAVKFNEDEYDHKLLTAEKAREKYVESNKKRNEAVLSDILYDIAVTCDYGKESRIVLDYRLDDAVAKILREDLGYTVRAMQKDMNDDVITEITW